MSRLPGSTYRLQFSKDRTFADARALTGYLDRLGIGALYASPLLESGTGSNHGYDVVDPSRISEERGGEAGLHALLGTLREHGLTLLLDIVPNHVGVARPAENPWWWDVLTHGQSSRWAHHFDVDWGAGRILLPVLDADEAGALENLTVADGELRYHEHRFPVAPGTGDGTAQEVHDRQHYRLVSWRRGAAELTYRRFFDVSDLAAVRVEDPEVFADAHRKVLELLRGDDTIVGLRVDHPDGLADPGGYVRRLRAEIGPWKWLLVEKILAVGEDLPASWPVDGTSGYEALREICGVFVDPDGAGLLTQFAAEHTGAKPSAHAVEDDGRHLVVDRILVAEVHRIADAFRAGPGADAAATGVDLTAVTAEDLHDAVAEFLCGFPVYRSYLTPAIAEGRAAADTAVSVARTRRPDLAAVITALHAGLVADPGSEYATRLQQTSGMVTAKGVEDTAFYRYNRFVALNEVGGDPARFGVSPTEFHAGLTHREAGRSRTMTTLSTHDTKRSEDVRARLAVLAERPGDWTEQVRRWSVRHPLPDRSLELLAWQSLVGAWPIPAERLASYLGKASKEAKLVTSHTDAVPEVDERIAAWAGEVLADAELVAEIEAFVSGIAGPGWSNSLGQKLLQMAGPGVPDVYQGTELFEYSLVDPDNRRPVDFGVRERLLERIDGGWQPPVDASGAAKLLVTSAAARLRRFRPELFSGYGPLDAQGTAASHAVAFSRGGGALVAVATRLPEGLARRGGWGDTTLPLPGGFDDWHDMIANKPVDGPAPALAGLLDRYPVALLVRPA
ncbi:Malto-oligosyltrehalose synthase [Pseudonocardia sp. Ae168_Ps1]|uniref:malto-oligosyltrehalose synthase n=1 Tax=unclassified Pseudonocardia TaxID=2619320 RepID=UPI00094AF120|nr:MULTISPECIES: malto-oligosyltrehalose synthase [unclassified Pseudonocardia]OLL71140.1 Malto-oligosyltrehalose synthase [Pseudonocardia sp. Ae168_Ps1]OLL77310.1 Malto-oligosyltrehalose synthase [Pseudonocardia sp. Ae150A_Ps1]OLL88580.1 Malto-oligosyltrehalose synthase [Pseudonocardia sp. Ae263_Ps1]OLL91399.1 Malto-oligosyltrehalose synthase [Pseudonocardia sp. Ae356_Ps1]